MDSVTALVREVKRLTETAGCLLTSVALKYYLIYNLDVMTRAGKPNSPQIMQIGDVIG